MPWRISLAFIFLALGGCASQVPVMIRQPPPESPSLSAVQEDIAHYQGSIVRWGGTIASIQNKTETTIVEIVARELDEQGRPKETDFSPGRFWAQVDGFLEPVIYQKGREITVYGSVEKLVEGQIGEYPYWFPLVQVKTYYLWAPRESRYYYYPYPYPYYYPYHFYPFWYYW